MSSTSANLTNQAGNSSEKTQTEFLRSCPGDIRFGSSSWTYPGWQGQIYQRNYRSDRDFRANSLGEYAAHGLFRTVGIDSSFYAPMSSETLQRYAEQVPSGFQWVSKVWEGISVPEFPRHKRYGDKAGQKNPNFLDAELFEQSVLTPCRQEDIRPFVGPFVFQFQMLPRAKHEEFLDTLEGFLPKLSKDFSYAVEVRNPELLSSRYFDMLNKSGVTHCFNHWSYMPALADQMRSAATAGGLEAPFFVSRILTPLGVSYQDAVKKFSPYTEIKSANTVMRRDVVRLIRRSLARNVPAFVVVNNRSEGNAPMTIEAIAALLQESLEKKPVVAE